MLPDPLESAAPAGETLTLTALMRIHLPSLIAAVRARWQGYQLSPDHDQINAMRGEVQLLVYWLARRVALYSRVSFLDKSGRRQQAAVGGFGGMQTTDLQHALWEDVLGRSTVTKLVQGTQTDLIAFLTRILVNAKISRYRRLLSEGAVIIAAEDIFPDGDEGPEGLIEDFLTGPDQAHVSAHICFEAMQCLEQFDAFIAAEKLHPKLELVAWELWMSAPLSDKDQGDTSDNKANQDAAMAERLGMPKKTFDRYKPQARALVARFRERTGW